MNLNGKIIVIEGTDGSGKQTQTARLRERLEASGCNVYTCSFPKYDSDSSAAVRMYLNGELGSDPKQISAKAASMFYAIDRYITFKKDVKDVYDKGESTILFDRFSASNIIHQGAKLIEDISDPEEKKEKLVSFINWLDKLEHEELEIPRADKVIYLRVPLEYTIRLRENRANKITGEEKQDIHERDNSHLKNASESGFIAAQILGWDVIECVKDNKMRTIEDIAEEIWQKINN